MAAKLALNERVYNELPFKKNCAMKKSQWNIRSNQRQLHFNGKIKFICAATFEASELSLIDSREGNPIVLYISVNCWRGRCQPYIGIFICSAPSSAIHVSCGCLMKLDSINTICFKQWKTLKPNKLHHLGLKWERECENRFCYTILLHQILGTKQSLFCSVNLAE